MKDRLKMFASFFIVALIFNKAISMSPRAIKIEEFRNAEVKKAESDYLKSTLVVDETNKNTVTNPDDYLVLINKDRSLPNPYEPGDLTIPQVDFSFDEDLEKRYLRAKAASQLEELFKASKEAGLELYAASGYRSYARQEQIYQAKLEKDGEKEARLLVALPGQSEHQTGLAMDLTSREIGFLLEEEFENTAEGQWLAKNAHKFGFIIRYPKGKEAITLYSYEPWHIRYVGDEATYIYENNLTLEEFLAEK